MTINATANAYKQLDTAVGINPATGLSDFIFYSDLQTSDNANLLFHINKALIKY